MNKMLQTAKELGFRVVSHDTERAIAEDDSFVSKIPYSIERCHQHWLDNGEPYITRVIGGAGTGKTTLMMGILDECQRFGIDWRDIGFVSFTRAARSEASKRAGKLFKLSPKVLESEGYFKTLHSICYHAVRSVNGNFSVIANNKETKEWLNENFQDSHLSQMDDGTAVIESRSNKFVRNCLSLWGVMRSKLSTDLDDVSNFIGSVIERDVFFEVIEHYEHAKKQSDMLDFIDLVLLFCGYEYQISGDTIGLDMDKSMALNVPMLKVWIHDEVQDASKLLGAAFKKLESQHTCFASFLAGDPFQSIYGWSGADNKVFLEWGANDEFIMEKSWRCPDNVMNAGELILAAHSEYFDRGINARDQGGWVGGSTWHDSLHDMLESKDSSWLVLARTNRTVESIAVHLKKINIPFKRTKGGEHWKGLKAQDAASCIDRLLSGEPITVREYKSLFLFRNKINGLDIFARGSKGKWASFAEHGMANDELLGDLGSFTRGYAGTGKDFTNFINELSMTFPGLNDKEKSVMQVLDAAKTFGWDTVFNPGVSIGTIHSVKGAEADHVVLICDISRTLLAKTESHRERWNEEIRVCYVGVTRARKTVRLVQVDEESKSLILSKCGSQNLIEAQGEVTRACVDFCIAEHSKADFYRGNPLRHGKKTRGHTG